MTESTFVLLTRDTEYKRSQEFAGDYEFNIGPSELEDHIGIQTQISALKLFTSVLLSCFLLSDRGNCHSVRYSRPDSSAKSFQ